MTIAGICCGRMRQQIPRTVKPPARPPPSAFSAPSCSKGKAEIGKQKAEILRTRLSLLHPLRSPHPPVQKGKLKLESRKLKFSTPSCPSPTLCVLRALLLKRES